MNLKKRWKSSVVVNKDKKGQFGEENISQKTRATVPLKKNMKRGRNIVLLVQLIGELADELLDLFHIVPVQVVHVLL